MKNQISLTEAKAIWIREGLGQSILADTTSVFLLGVLFWFNYNFIGGSYFVNFMIFLLFFFKIHHYATKKIIPFASRKDLIEYLQKLEAEESK